jgi:hypothetical protein
LFIHFLYASLSSLNHLLSLLLHSPTSALISATFPVLVLPYIKTTRFYSRLLC